MPLTKVIALPTGYASDEPTPGPDGLYRDTVVELPVLDAEGHRLFVAMDGDGHALGLPPILPARSDDDVERVRRKLWGRVYAWRDRDRPTLIK